MAEIEAQSQLLQVRSQTLLEGSDPHARQVLAAASPLGPNLGLLEWCLKQIGWHDLDLIHDLQHGFPLIGHIPADQEAPKSIVRRQVFSQSQLESLGADSWRSQLRRHSRAQSEFDLGIWTQTMDEVSLGRMTNPTLAQAHHPHIVTRRFGVCQSDSKGASKIRCIDDFKESLINDGCCVDRRIRMGRISDLQSVVRSLSAVGEPLYLLKSDFKAAYRSLPVATSHLGLARVILRDPSGQVFVSTQLAMPFGAVASVYAWDRIGAALAAILQEFLLIPCARYVDDLFWADFVLSASTGRAFALHLVHLLGFTLEESKTPAPSTTQTILGVQIAFKQDRMALEFSPDPRKAELWMTEIETILSNQTSIDLVQFRKLTGRLGFAAWAIWGQASRCHLKGLHQQVRVWSPSLLKQAVLDLHWWRRELQRLAVLVCPLGLSAQEPLLVYTDASGAGGLGAVFVGPSSCCWVSGQVPRGFGHYLKRRRTQICVYETLMVVCALRIFGSHFHGCRVVFFVDNQSALGALRQGTSSSWDLRALVEVFWDRMATLQCQVFFRFVPSKLNLADWPSRRRPAVIGHQIPWRPRFEKIMNNLAEARAAA